MREQFTKNQSEFHKHYMISSLPGMRLGLTVTLGLFFGFVVFNSIFFPDLPEMKFYLRFWVISPVIILSIGVTYIRSLYRWLHPIYIIINLLICIAIFYVGAGTSHSQKGYEYFFAWVMLVVIGLFVFYRMPFRTLVIIGLLQVITYVIASVYNGTYGYNPFLFCNNLFFVLAMYSVGFLLAFMFRSLNWKNYLHQAELAENNLKLKEEIKERKHAEQAFQQSEIQYHNTLNSIPDLIFVVDRNFRIVLMNSALKDGQKTVGLSDDVVGKHIQESSSFITAASILDLQAVFDSGEISIREQQIFVNDQVYHMENRKIPIFKNNEVIQVMTILRDRSKEKEVEELKQRNAEQKEIMLREIHHRVKNNLTIVISLLNLQLRNNANPELTRIIRDIEMRIRSMALIHEHLYRSENIDVIPLASYLHSLASIITSTFSGHRISLVTHLEPAGVNIETALPIGLIANELLTNAYKYAFPDHKPGEIDIHLKKDSDDLYTLVIRDNGVGLPAGFSLDSEKSLGMFIVRLLVEQIDGTLEIDQQQGTAFIIRFRNLTVKSR
ncbi:MAG: histidine kinase dimerization/phosphoacceptor domain -containing protein [Bacteroidota bacterium]